MALTPQKKSGRGLYQPLSDINVTPLVDVMLVLLIVFMVTAPMLASGMHINLPQAKSAAPLKPNETVVVTVDKDGKIAVNGGETAPDVLVDTVRARLAGHEDQPIYLKGDRDAPYGAIISVMDQLAGNGLTKIAVVADRKAPPKW